MENASLAREIVCGIRWLAHVVSHDAAKMGKRFGLTVAQSSVVRLLALDGAMSSAELARRLFVTPANITGIVDRLEKKGLAERIRQSTDRRVVLVSLTPEGRSLGQSLPDPLERKLSAGLDKLDPENKRELARSMEQILEMMDASDMDDIFWP